MKPTLKADVLKNARGLSLGAPVSVTRDDDDPKQTRRLTPAELDELIGTAKRPRRAYYVGVGVLCAFTVGASLGAFSLRRPVVPPMPPPVRPTAVTRTLVATEIPSAAPTASARPRLLRKRPRVDVKQPLFSPYDSM